MTCLGLFFLVSYAGYDLSGLDPNRLEIHRLYNIGSPTSVLRVGKDLFLAADLIEAKPGIYRLHHRPGQPYHASLALFLPKQAVDGLYFEPDGYLRIVSGRRFTINANDWKTHILRVDPVQFRTVDNMVLPVDDRCPNQTLECGAVGAHPLSDGSWLVITRQKPAKIHLIVKLDGVWQVSRSVPLYLDGRYVTVTESRLYDKKLLLLIKDRWLLAELAIENLDWNSLKFNMKTAFDFSHLKKRFQLTNIRYSYRGLAEGFDFDETGNLLVVLNNRGYNFRKSPDEVLDDAPKLLVFTKQP